MNNQFDENYCIAKFQAIENAAAKEAIEMMYKEGEFVDVRLKNISTFNEGKIEMLWEIVQLLWGTDYPREVLRAYWHSQEVLASIEGIASNLLTGVYTPKEED